jgi:retron-type reverse transcriptase
MNKYYPLEQSKFYKVTTRRKLASIFGITEVEIHKLWAMPIPFSSRQIEVLRNGVIKTRHVQEPRGTLRPIHSRTRKLLSRIEPPDFLFCPVKGRSYVGNAAVHINSKEIRTLDVANYFPSTPRHRVFWFFETVMKCNRDVASILAKLLTANGNLATGSTVSPILSFYAFRDMWLTIADLARAANCTLSVYMDDVTVSGESVPESLMWQIRQQVHSRGLKYHKERHYRGGMGEVTGVIVRDQKTVLPNRQRKKVYDLRAALRDTQNADNAEAIQRKILGMTTQQKQVERS